MQKITKCIVLPQTDVFHPVLMSRIHMMNSCWFWQDFFRALSSLGMRFK